MNDAMLVWGILFIPWVLGVALLATSRRQGEPDADISATGWLGIIIIAACLIAFFFSAAWQFGRVVWVIPMLGFWAFIVWLTFDQMRRRAW